MENADILEDGEITIVITWLSEICLTSLIALF